MLISYNIIFFLDFEPIVVSDELPEGTMWYFDKFKFLFLVVFFLGLFL